MDIKEIRATEIKLFDLWQMDGDCNDEGKPVKFSPIEKIFYLNFNRWIASNLPIGGFRANFFHMEYQCPIEKVTGHMGPLIDAPPKNCYVIDFLLTFIIANTNRRYISVAIELDGHDFHEKTKEQAQRDKQKDRFLQSRGHLVARFTGAEVWEDPLEVFSSIANLVYDVASVRKKNA